MDNFEARVNSPDARWLMPEKGRFASIKSGDPLPFLDRDNPDVVFAPLRDELKHFFTHTAEGIDWRYGAEEFRQAVDDILYINTLMDFAIINSKPRWDTTLITDLKTPEMNDSSLEFVGYGSGGSFRAAISGPDNYSAVAELHKRLFGDMPDMMDIDRKLPVTDPFDPFLRERLAPAVIRLLSTGDTFNTLPILPEDKGVMFKEVMRLSNTDGTPQSVVSVRVVQYVSKTVLEVRLSDIRKGNEPRTPDFTIHVTSYEKSLRIGPQMPTSINTIIPLYYFSGDEIGYSQISQGVRVNNSQWMALSTEHFAKARKDFEYPEVITDPTYATTEEALHAGLRAIAEKTQHLEGRAQTHGDISLSELLKGDWYVKYRKSLRKLFRKRKTEMSVFGRENRFLTSEILRLFNRLSDYDAETFLRMAVPMGIMDVLEPGFKHVIEDYGHMLNGPAFSHADPFMVDWAIKTFAWHCHLLKGRSSRDVYDINKPELLGSIRFLNFMGRYRKLRKMRTRGPMKDVRFWLMHRNHILRREV